MSHPNENAPLANRAKAQRLSFLSREVWEVYHNGATFTVIRGEEEWRIYHMGTCRKIKALLHTDIGKEGAIAWIEANC